MLDCTQTQQDTAINCADVVGFNSCGRYWSQCAYSCCESIKYNNLSPPGSCIASNNSYPDSYQIVVANENVCKSECVFFFHNKYQGEFVIRFEEFKQIPEK